MTPYAMEQLATQRTAEFQAEAARRRPAGNSEQTIRHVTGWALIHIGLAMVNSSARRQHRTASAELR
jgi:hypothetical protein